MNITLDQIELCRDGTRDVTAILQDCINQIAQVGGGTLIVTAGTYLTGTLHLPSHFRLELQSGATLLAQTQDEHYPPIVRSEAEQSKTALLYAYQATNIEICGSGTIDGQGEAFFLSPLDEQGYRLPRYTRPRIIVFEQCSHIKLHDFMILNAPMWTIHLVSSHEIAIDNVTVDNDLTMPNTDAIDIDSCQLVTIHGCHLSAGDDDICLKTTDKLIELQQPVSNVIVSDCLLRSKSCAIKIGSETFADISQVIMHDCVIYDSNRGIGVFSRDGGKIFNCAFSNINFECRHAAPCHWGQADPVFISVRDRESSRPAGWIHHISFHHLQGCAEGAINLHADPAGSIQQVEFDHIDFSQDEGNPQIQHTFDVRPPCNPSQPEGTGLDNAYLLNPKTNLPYGIEQYPQGLPGVYSQGVTDLHLSEIHIDRPTPLPSGWSKNVIQEF